MHVYVSSATDIREQLLRIFMGVASLGPYYVSNARVMCIQRVPWTCFCLTSFTSPVPGLLCFFLLMMLLITQAPRVLLQASGSLHNSHVRGNRNKATNAL